MNQRKLKRHTMATVNGSSVALIALALATASHASLAQDSKGGISSFLDKTHVLSLGAAEQTMDAGIRATAGERDPIKLTLKDLGLGDNDTSYYAAYQYRWKPRWVLIGGAYGFKGTGGRTAQRDFNYDGVDYTAGAALAAELEVDAYLLDVMYSARRGDNYELMVGGGIHALDLGASITGIASINGEAARATRSGTTLLAPVPNLRFSGVWEPTERIVLTATFGWLSANVDEYSGDFTYAHLRAMYRFSDRFGLSLGYQHTDIDITQKRERSELNYDLRFDGPTLTFSYAF
jgi:hypothetical protein